MTDVVASVGAVMDGVPPENVQAARSYLWRLEVLGHLDQSWSEGKWRIRPTMVTQLPGSSAFALVVGKRSPELEERLEADTVLHKLEQSRSGIGSLSDPRTLIVEYDNEAELRQVASSSGADFISCAALSIAEDLPSLGLGPLAGGPNTQGSPVQMFNVRMGKFMHVETFHRDGLFKQKVNGRSVYWLLRSGIWYSTTYAEGVCLTRVDIDKECFELQITEDADDPIGMLRVDKGLPLPMPHFQALTLCSGFHPDKTSDGSWTFENIPSSVANAVAQSVHQQLQIV
ncbi:hypothetical protein [Arthrobacter psychrochitiniphilus]|nr:hypothetical protein [Arthrobacter psychrochitiniphilus]NYG16389.1 hypothetical protein [Arthrobacter psychrochitiniphilus]